MRSNTNVYLKYFQQFDELVTLINESNNRVVQIDSDTLFMEHLNLFTKSYLVMSVTYLESYLKEVCLLIVNHIDRKLLANPLPQNIIKWSILRKKDKDNQFIPFSLNIQAKDIDDEISGNVHKTIALFANLGIDLLSVERFQNNKDKIASIVIKRNDIVHHNDDASDLSFSDIIINIDIIKEYILTIDNEVINFMTV
ncbi:HEPN domain-containing protein [Gracilibacillus sp. Marseille-QA3620]